MRWSNVCGARGRRSQRVAGLGVRRGAVMVIAVASGKGGTGKTTVAVNLAVVASARGVPVQLADCDVEEPNCHIFLHPTVLQRGVVYSSVPRVDEARCTGCGRCQEVCHFNAIACLKKRVLVFAELCHGCGACALACPEGAIAEEQKELGVVETGQAGALAFVQGRLRVGEPRSAGLVREVRRRVRADRVAIIDAPPGTACAMVQSVRGVDYVLLVTEPTPFGLSDLEMAVQTLRRLSLPMGVVVNRCDIGDDRVLRYCQDEDLAVLAAIPSDRRVAEAYSAGRVVAEAVPGMWATFERLWESVGEAVPA
jgi:MinD superfamily P-loop ATPase